MKSGALFLQGLGHAEITDTKIYAKRNTNCIRSEQFEDNKQSLTINGNTLLHNSAGSSGNFAAITWKGTGPVTINEGVEFQARYAMIVSPDAKGHSANVDVTGANINCTGGAIQWEGGDGKLSIQRTDLIATGGTGISYVGTGESTLTIRDSTLTVTNFAAFDCAGTSSIELYNSSVLATSTGSSDTTCIAVRDASSFRAAGSTLNAESGYLFGVTSTSPINVTDSVIRSRNRNPQIKVYFPCVYHGNQYNRCLKD